ncbi:MAG: hypothetical protein WD042_08215 [Phycisphaeraceae bacterium]
MDSLKRLLLADDLELLGRVEVMVGDTVKQVMAAVNAARDGHLIDDSEVAANDLLNDLKRRVYQEAIQTRIDATQASFFPSGPGDGASSGKQGPGIGVASGVAGPGRGEPAALP